jgi:uncharacterized membrane protein/nitrite reductase/ring-hydroxylating ferredoxin subunit
MRSKASFKGHPIHPILVTFPIALFVTTLVFDIVNYAGDGSAYQSTARFLSIAAICSALLAAVPGLIDFIYTVPPDSSGKKRAAKHGILNVTVVALFIVALILRDEETQAAILALEGVGVVLLSISGWLGGTLVYRNQIGVDLRYASAGKWKEEYFDESDQEIDLGPADQLKINQMKLIHVGSTRIVLARTEQGYRAFDDRCTHRGGSLVGGAMICGTVQCPWHGSQFKAADGKVAAGPAVERISVYEVIEDQGKIRLKR